MIDATYQRVGQFRCCLILRFVAKVEMYQQALGMNFM
jgi:hypothetical protein